VSLRTSRTDDAPSQAAESRTHWDDVACFLLRWVIMAERQLPDFLAYGDLSRHGLSRHGLEQLVAQAEFERVAPGAFIRTGLTADTTAALIAATAKKPQATICLLSALSIHDLTDEIPTRSDIALSRGSQPPRITISPVRWHRFDPATFEVGRTSSRCPGAGVSGCIRRSARSSTSSGCDTTGVPTSLTQSSDDGWRVRAAAQRRCRRWRRTSPRPDRPSGQRCRSCCSASVVGSEGVGGGG